MREKPTPPTPKPTCEKCWPELHTRYEVFADSQKIKSSRILDECPIGAHFLTTNPSECEVNFHGKE